MREYLAADEGVPTLRFMPRVRDVCADAEDGVAEEVPRSLRKIEINPKKENENPNRPHTQSVVRSPGSSKSSAYTAASRFKNESALLVSYFPPNWMEMSSNEADSMSLARSEGRSRLRGWFGSIFLIEIKIRENVSENMRDGMGEPHDGRDAFDFQRRKFSELIGDCKKCR